MDALWRAVVRVVSMALPGCEIIAALPLEGLIPVTFRTTFMVGDPATYWQRVNATGPPMAKLIVESPGLEVSFFDDDMTAQALEASPFYHEIMSRRHPPHVRALVLGEQAFLLPHRLGALAAQGPFSDAERGVIREMHPHFAAALIRVRSIDRLIFIASLLSESLEVSSDGLILLDFRQIAIFHNRAAEQACRLWRSGHEAAARNRLRGEVFRLPDDMQQAVAGLILKYGGADDQAALSGHFIGGKLPSGLPGLAVRMVLISPLAHASSPYVRSELSRVMADQGPVPTFKLSEAEKRVASRVAKGMRNEQVAVLLSLSVNTVRAHLRQIFDKLGVIHRGQLAALFPVAAKAL